jgi:hypothetical protein
MARANGKTAKKACKTRGLARFPDGANETAEKNRQTPKARGNPYFFPAVFFPFFIGPFLKKG